MPLTEDRYSTVTLHIPSGYFIRHLSSMALITARFRGIHIRQGEVPNVTIFGTECQAAKEVSEWAMFHLPPR